MFTNPHTEQVRDESADEPLLHLTVTEVSPKSGFTILPGVSRFGLLDPTQKHDNLLGGKSSANSGKLSTASHIVVGKVSSMLVHTSALTWSLLPVVFSPSNGSGSTPPPSIRARPRK